MRVVSASRPAPSLRRLLSMLVVLTLAALCPACSSGRKPVHPARGQVLVKGRPATRAQITFHPVDETGPAIVRPVGSVDDKGNFTLTSYKEGDGAPEGEYRVTVQWFLATRTGHPGGDDTVAVNYLPERYGRADTSGLRVTINKGDNELPPFVLSPR
jgi:hypothetical protein